MTHFGTLPVSLSIETAAFAQISETVTAQGPVLNISITCSAFIVLGFVALCFVVFGFVALSLAVVARPGGCATLCI